MTSHELAQRLLAGPDQEVLINTVNGMETVNNVVVETKETTFHHFGETNAENYFPELKGLDEKRHQHYVQFGANSNNFPTYEGKHYDLFKEKNNEPAVILVSDSIGLS